METGTLLNEIAQHLKSQQLKRFELRVEELLAKTGQSSLQEHWLHHWEEQLQKAKLECHPPLSLQSTGKEVLTLTLQAEEQQSPNSGTGPPGMQEFFVPDDFFNYLFDLGSKGEYERFHAALDSHSPVGLFLIPLKKDFYSDVVERTLSFEILRKRHYKGDFNVGNVSYLELGSFFNENQQEKDAKWNEADIYHFNPQTMWNVILGQSAGELIESERFDRHFNQLTLYANKYYTSQFFIVFHCPPIEEIIRHGREELLEKLISWVNSKFPFVFRLQCKYEDDWQIDSRVKQLILKHFKILMEVPQYEVDPNLSLIDAFSDMQKALLQVENQLLLGMEPSLFRILGWGNESDEHIYLKYFAIRTLIYRRGYHESQLSSKVAGEDETKYENHQNPDVKAGKEIVVEIETLRRKSGDKNVYLDLVGNLRSKSRSWDREIQEAWIVLPGFEIARNYYQIQKSLELLAEDHRHYFNPEFRLQIMAPDYANRELVPVNFSRIYEPDLVIQTAQHLRKHTDTVTAAQTKLTFDSVRGLYEEKTILKDLKQLQNEGYGLGLGGILLYGLPGCGKTYLSTAFANELDRNFFNFTPADIKSIWIGQAQKNIHEIFAQAKSKSPSLLFLDELDSIGFDRSDQLAGPEQRSTINQLLIEINNVDENQVLVIGATNRLNALDTGLKRSGRFDLKMPIFPPNEEERADIFDYYISLINRELTIKGLKPFEIGQSYFNYMGEEAHGFTSSDIKAFCNKLRIDALLNKREAYDINRIIDLIKKFIVNGQRSLSKEDIANFIEECQTNDNYSPKIEFLRYEWNI